MAVPLFTQIMSIHNTFATKNDISIVRGHLTHWSAIMMIRNCLGSDHEPETDLCRNSRWACAYVYVCMLCRRRVCTLDNLRRGNQSLGKRTKVCVTAGLRDAACGERVRTELVSAGTLRAQHALPAPALSERERARHSGNDGRSKALRHSNI